MRLAAGITRLTVPVACTGVGSLLSSPASRRTKLPLMLASESIRNCAETTTSSPALTPSTISIQSPLSMPISTSRDW